MNRLRKFIAKPSAGLRIRIHPTLQSEQIGVVPVEGACFLLAVCQINFCLKAVAKITFCLLADTL